MVCGRAYRGLALKHHPDKALQQCRWSVKLGRTGAASAHVTAPSGGVEASLKAAANEVFGFLSSAHEELTSSASRSKVRWQLVHSKAASTKSATVMVFGLQVSLLAVHPVLIVHALLQAAGLSYAHHPHGCVALVLLRLTHHSYMLVPASNATWSSSDQVFIVMA